MPKGMLLSLTTTNYWTFRVTTSSSLTLTSSRMCAERTAHHVRASYKHIIITRTT